MNRTPNRLAQEKSPYLLQHAHNPVDWRPWSEEAFRAAKEQDKPVLVSIGYATCHWCHVMERESFEDEEVGRALNEAFVCIKVDREERPDVDKIYMTACNLMTGRGGWPLNVLLTPDKAPFFAATYIPRDSRFGHPGLLDLTAQVQKLWREKREDILVAARGALDSLRLACEEGVVGGPSTPGQGPTEIGEELFNACYREFADSFDAVNGGFGLAPKFPSLHNLLFLLRVYERFSYPRALEMVEKTLTSIRRGGIYDQLGYGMHRYSTDERWLLPHFEKMLYDQAMLLLTCAETYRISGKPFFKEIAGEVAEYVLRDMTGRDGAFYTAEDADSEGEEGKFYVFEREELLAILGEEDGRLAEAWYGVQADGNFLDEASKERTGANVLHQPHERAWFAGKHGLSAEELDTRLENIRQRLLGHRLARPRPLLDDKALTELNGLMIAALARAGRLCEKRHWVAAGRRSAEFVLSRLVGPDGALLRRFREDEAGLPAHLDDYAFLAWGLTELGEATSEDGWIQRAVALMDTLCAGFWDERQPGFFFSAADRKELPVRVKDVYDNAIPGGNGVALLLLERLGRLATRGDFLDKAQGMRAALGPYVSRAPMAYAFLLTAAMESER
jgi:uncharacterized protein YyaL (SSP411 family)